MKQEIQDVPEQEQHFRQAWLLFLIQGIVIAAAGIVLVIWPKAGLTFTAVVIGLALAADGINRIINSFYFLSRGRKDHFAINLIRGLLQIVLGAFILTKPAGAGRLGAAFFLTLAGVFIIVWTVIDLLKSRNAFGYVKFRIDNIIFLVLGAVLITVPVISADFILRLIGLTAVAAGGFSLYMAVRLKKTIVKE